MRIKQYVYFALDSEVATGADIAERVGMRPDRSLVRGSKVDGPKPRPRQHTWEVICAERGLTIDDQIARVMERLQPVRPAIQACVADAVCTARLQAVRMLGAWLGPDEGEEEEIPPIDEDGLEKLSGQHQLLGWRLDSDTMAFLVAVGAFLDVDEYG